MPPLKAIYRTQVAFFSVAQASLVQELPGAVTVPNLDALIRQMLCMGVALHEPKELLHHTSPKNTLRRQQRERFAEVEAHRRSKDRDRADAGAVIHRDTF